MKVRSWKILSPAVLSVGRVRHHRSAANVHAILDVIISPTFRRAPEGNPSTVLSLLRNACPANALARALAVFVLVLVMPGTMAAQEATPGVLPGQDPDAPCANGRLQIGDLAEVDATIQAGVERATRAAQAWQPDARLYTLRLGCPLLTSGYRWEGVFFSETAQALYSTDTGSVDAVEADPDTIPTLDPAGISMQDVYRTLVRAGFADDLLLSAAGGVTIRPSTDANPFGPESAPRNQLYAHVAIEVSGQVTDVWVSLEDNTVYRYGR